MEKENQQPEPQCEVCKVGVILGITKHVCEQQGKEHEPVCNELYTKAVMGEIKISEFIDKVKEIAKDPLDQKTLKSLEEVLTEYGFK